MRLNHHPALHAGELIDSSPGGRCRASRRWSTACTGGAWPTGASSRSRRTPTSRGMSAPRGRSCGSTPTRTRSRRALGGDPLLGPLVRAAPGRRIPGHPDPRRARRAGAARPADLRRGRAHARGPADRGARRAAGRAARRRHAPLPRPRPRSRRSTRRRCRCRAPAAARSCAWPRRWRRRAGRRAPAGHRAVDGGLRRAALRRRRRVPADRPRREARALGARRRPGRGGWRRRGGRPRLRRRHLWAAAGGADCGGSGGSGCRGGDPGV